MNKEIDTKSLGLIGGFFMIALSILLFFLVWNVTKSSVSSSDALADQYQSIDIQSDSKSADDLTKGKNNFSGMPITAPTTTSTDRPSPF